MESKLFICVLIFCVNLFASKVFCSNGTSLANNVFVTQQHEPSVGPNMPENASQVTQQDEPSVGTNIPDNASQVTLQDEPYVGNNKPVNQSPVLIMPTDKIKIKGHTAYHFKKVVREISQELLISRKMDVNPLMISAQALADTAVLMGKYCENFLLEPKALPQQDQANFMTPYKEQLDEVLKLKAVLYNSTKVPRRKTAQEFTYVDPGTWLDRASAKAVCSALGLQLPEVYDSTTSVALTKFLISNNVSHCHAGIEPDFITGIQRFIGTALPIWQGFHSEIHDARGNLIELRAIIDELGGTFVYDNKSRLIFENTFSFYSMQIKTGCQRCRPQNHTLLFIDAPTVCQTKFDGNIPPYSSSKDRATRLDILNLRIVGLKRKKRASLVPSLSEEMETSRMTCRSVASAANESSANAFHEISDLLGQIDISMRSPHESNRKKRFIGLITKPLFTLGTKMIFKTLKPGRFKFSTGTKQAWSVFGLVQSGFTQYRIHKIKKHDKAQDQAIADNSNKIARNSADISKMTRTLEEHSFAISQLTVAREELETQLKALDTRVGFLEFGQNKLEVRTNFNENMQLLNSIISRINDGLYLGLDRLRDIVHSALLGQTSPLLLPPDQLDLVQAEVLKASSADLDTDFSRMQSIIVSDPDDSRLLLVLISATALARRNQELINLIAIPGFGKSGTFIPKLDYNSVVLDQLENSYTVLNENEVNGCLTGKCLMSNQERPANDHSCGMPQYFDRQHDACDYEEITSNGVFVQPLLPDGVIFSFKTAVVSQLFCNSDVAVGSRRQLTGAGVLSIPPGCQIVITNPDGNSIKIKGLPIPHLITADELHLISEEQAKIFQTAVTSATTVLERKPHYQNLIHESVAVMNTQMASVDDKVKRQNTHAWALTGVVCGMTIIMVGIIFAMYKYRAVIKRKWRTLQVHIGNVAKIITDLKDKTLGHHLAAVEIPSPSRRRSFIRQLSQRFKSTPSLRDPEYNNVDPPASELRPILKRHHSSCVSTHHVYPCDELESEYAEARDLGAPPLPPRAPPKYEPNAPSTSVPSRHFIEDDKVQK